MALRDVYTSREDGNIGITATPDKDKRPLIVGIAQDGSATPVTFTGTGSLTATIGGNPTAAYDIKILLTLGGNIATAKFKVSYDGGTTYGEEITSTVAAHNLLSNITLTWGGTGGVLNDTYEFSTTKGAPINTPILVQSDTFRSEFGTGRLVDYLDEYFRTKTNGLLPYECYAIRPENDTSGAIGTPVVTQTGTGTIAFSGTPKRDMNLVVEIVLTDGACETAKYHYSFDGGVTWSDIYTTPATTTAAYIGYGVSATFTNGGTPADSYDIGDKWEVTVTAPYAADEFDALSSDLLTVRSAIKNLYSFSSIIMTNTTDLDDWNVMSTLIDDLESVNALVTAIMPVGEVELATLSTDITDIINEVSTFYDTRISLVFSRFNSQRTDNLSAAILLAGREATTSVSKDAGYLGTFDNISSVVLVDDLRPYADTLTNNRLIVLRDFPDQALYTMYFDKSFLMSPSNSDYRYRRDIRTINKTIRVIRTIAVSFLGRDVDVAPGVLESIAAVIQRYAIQQMAADLSQDNPLQIQVLSSLSELQLDSRLRLRVTINGKLVINDIYVSVGFNSAA